MEGMKENQIRLYNIFSIFLLTGVLLWMGLRLAGSEHSNTVKMGVMFNSVSSNILEDIFSEKRPVSRTSNFVKLSNLALSTPSLKSLVIIDRRNMPVYVFARNKYAVQKGKTSPIQVINTLTDRKTTTFDSYNGNVYQSTAVFTVLKDSFIMQTIKIGLSILLIYCLVSIIVMILMYCNRTRSPSVSTENPGRRAPTEEPFPLAKLSSELKRAASFDQDLVLVLIDVDTDFLNNHRDSFLELLHETFSYSDLIFQYSDSGFALILPNEDVDSGITHIRDFDQEAAKEFDTLNLYPFHYGLSSRNGRLIGGQTLYHEAEAALKKSKGDPAAHIIGFRPDPAKYRDFLSKENG